MHVAAMGRWRAMGRAALGISRAGAGRRPALPRTAQHGRPDAALCQCSNLTARLVLWAMRHVDHGPA